MALLSSKGESPALGQEPQAPAHPFSASPMLPTRLLSLRTACCLWKMPCSSTGNALLLLCFLVTSTPPSRAAQMPPAPPHLHPFTRKHLGCISSTELAPALRSIRVYASLHLPEKEGQGPRPACVPGLNSGGQGWNSCTARGRRPPPAGRPAPSLSSGFPCFPGPGLPSCARYTATASCIASGLWWRWGMERAAGGASGPGSLPSACPALSATDPFIH